MALARTDERFREAYNSLLDYCDRLTPGDQLPTEQGLAVHLNVSRTVVRAALQRMQTEGLIRWQGREKTLLRLPNPKDRLTVQLDPISREELERQFLDWVLRFDVPPGTALNVTELARNFGVTPHSLQEFLASLSRFGLVRRRPRGGWKLLGFTPDYAIELSDFRMVLELNAISQLVALPSDHSIWKELRHIQADHHALALEIDERFHDFSLLDERFHNMIGNVIRNRFTAEFQKVISLIFHYHYQWDKKLERDRNLAAIGEHLALIEALIDRDEQAALEAAKVHLRTSKQTLLSSLRNHAHSM